LPIVEAPVVAYPLRWLEQAGVTAVTVCANSASRAVRAEIEARIDPGTKLDFSEDWMPRGAAGCVRDAAAATDAQTFVVVDATTIPNLDLSALVASHRAQGAALTVAVHPEAAGSASPFLSPTGVYVFDRSTLQHIAEHGFQDIKEALIPRLHAAGQPIAFHECTGRCPRILDAESYLDVNRWMISRLNAADSSAEIARKGYELREGAFIHASARVSPSARLVGPLVVGPGATVEDLATLVGPGSLGRDSVVASGAVVCRSVVWADSRLGRDSLVDGCLVAEGVVVPPRSSRYRMLETGGLQDGETSLLPGSWALARLQGWVDSVLPALRPGPTRRPVPAHSYPEPSSVERAIALGRVRS
jgi:NDP-sugar pyrophosphorylase family protein